LNNQAREIVVEDVLPHSVGAVWTALTTANLIQRWLMPNDFTPVVGAKFTFRRPPLGGWDGVVQCEVLECVPREKLVYSWKGGDLDTVLTWHIRPVDQGTHLKMVHSGFQLPKDQLAFDAMFPGWGRIVERIQSVIREAALDAS
jgi:uncharacterized protein YndB with AHSA1/START domain